MGANPYPFAVFNHAHRGLIAETMIRATEKRRTTAALTAPRGISADEDHAHRKDPLNDDPAMLGEAPLREEGVDERRSHEHRNARNDDRVLDEIRDFVGAFSAQERKSSPRKYDQGQYSGIRADPYA